MEVIEGKVRIPKDYFNRAAKREYSLWANALIREFLQNSIDAGSSEVHFKFNRERLSLVVQDDGCGMDKNIILNKLLSLGGTHKKEGAIGGFGKAKEILFFAWKKYAIHTKNWLIEGEGADYTIKAVKQRFNGTRCVIIFYSYTEFSTVQTAAAEYLPKNEVTATIYLNSKKINYKFNQRKLFQKLTWGDIFTCDGQSRNVSVRVNGLEMFEHFVSVETKYKVILEMGKCSTDILTANRDSLNYKYLSELQGFIQNLAINPISLTYNIQNDIQELILGRRKLTIPESLLLAWGENKFEVIELQKFNKSQYKLNNIYYDFVIRKSPIYSNIKIKEFMEDPVSESLALLWISILFEISVANKIGIQGFYPGFVFHHNVKGLCAGSEDFPSLLINPLIPDILMINSVSFLREILEDIAYHELAHINNRKHDEIFVLLMEKYRTKHREWKNKGGATRNINHKNELQKF